LSKLGNIGRLEMDLLKLPFRAVKEDLRVIRALYLAGGAEIEPQLSISKKKSY
jgi:hypothetical protein